MGRVRPGAGDAMRVSLTLNEAEEASLRRILASDPDGIAEYGCPLTIAGAAHSLIRQMLVRERMHWQTPRISDLMRSAAEAAIAAGWPEKWSGDLSVLRDELLSALEGSADDPTRWPPERREQIADEIWPRYLRRVRRLAAASRPAAAVEENRQPE